MHILSMGQFPDRDSIESILTGSKKMVQYARDMVSPYQLRHWARLLFFEASTRTRESFDTAAKILGMNVTQVAGPEATSLMKDETLSDTCLTYAMLGAHVIVIRTPYEGGPRFVAEWLQRAGENIDLLRERPVTIINGGDGKNQHPTQCFLDLITIELKLGRLDNFTIGIAGDLKYGRTSHSLIQALSRFKNVKVVLVSSDEARMPDAYKQGVSIAYEGNNVRELRHCDVVYVTRPQLERIKDALERERLLKWFTITLATLEILKPEVIIMHPLPCTGEIAAEIKFDRRFIAWTQLWHGIPTRIYLLKQGCESHEPLDLALPSENLIRAKTNKKVISKPEGGRYFSPINRGFVIDHIPPSCSALVRKILEEKGCLPAGVTLLKAEKVKTSRLPNSLKDVLLALNGQLPDDVGALINLAIPGMTYNHLSGNGQLTKTQYRAPSAFTGVFTCANPDCITNRDRNATTRFKVLGRGATKGNQLRCHYCERTFKKKEIIPPIG